ncbi:MAG: ribonuclease E/G, partial [Myxococcota bacterium]|nr:ribonuclease E/G [Myxococcota bacterium]
LFSRYQIEDQIDDVFARRIELPSGGSIVIEQTEALVSIDVNSGRVKTDDIEKTALTTNLEAASEIARQLKLRDLGGLVVVDFIDMRSRENTRNVEQSARDAFANDKAKVKFSRISDFGLMEISRQRLKSSIMKGSFEPCTACGGTGKSRSVESSALYLLRRIKETVLRGTNYMHMSATMPVDVANYVLNRKRADLIDLQQKTRTTIDIKGTVDCAPNRAFVEILATSGRGKRPRRILLTFDLVRSDVDRRELGDLEEVLVDAAVARGVSLDENEFSRLYRAIEEKMASDAEIVAAQYESERERAVAEAVEATEDAHAKALDAAAVTPKIGIIGWWRKVLYGDSPPVKQIVVAEAPAAVTPPSRRASTSERNERRRGRGDRDRDRNRRGDRRRGKLESNRTEAKPTTKASQPAGTEDAPAKKRRRRRRRKRSDGEGGEQGQAQQAQASQGSREASSSGDNKAPARSGDRAAERSSNRRSSGRKPSANAEPKTGDEAQTAGRKPAEEAKKAAGRDPAASAEPKTGDEAKASGRKPKADVAPKAEGEKKASGRRPAANKSVKEGAGREKKAAADKPAAGAKGGGSKPASSTQQAEVKKTTETKKPASQRAAASKPSGSQIPSKKPAPVRAPAAAASVPRPGGVVDLRASAPKAANGDD